MQYLLFILLFISTLFSTILLVPEEYATIQSGIDAAAVGDTVLVSDGMYDENLILDKSIVLASYAVYDELSEWITDDDYIYAGQWIVANSHIANTRIRGYNPNDPDFGSVILISTEEDECIQPEIIGFTIEGGNGTRVIRENDEGEEYSTTLGGGILADVSNPLIHFNQFVDNGSNHLFSGGGMYATTEPEDWGFDNRRNSQPRCEINEIQISNNLYNNNDALYGNTFSNTFYEGEIDMSASIFDVFNCNEQIVSPIWVDTESEADVNFENGAGNLCAFTAPNVYVDSSIEQECLDEGCGFESSPFKTIDRANSVISATEINPITIHLANGVYSSDSGENFPIELRDYTNIKGENEELTILDGMNESSILYIEDSIDNTIENLSIIRGSSTEGVTSSIIDFLGVKHLKLNHLTFSNNQAPGAAIKIMSSNTNVQLANINLFNNHLGSGISIVYSDGPLLNNIVVSDNYADEAISMYLSNATLMDLVISNNSNNGIYLNESSPKIMNTLIYGNEVGIECWHFSNPYLVNTTITDNRDNGIQMFFESYPIIQNSIIWNNDWPNINEIGVFPGYLDVSYSNIADWNEENFDNWIEGQGNIESDPLFINPEEGDYGLQSASPCINSGNPNVWFQDQDETISDMGYTGGLGFTSSSFSIDFSNVGNLDVLKDITFYNSRETSIVIDDIQFDVETFSIDLDFPITIEANSYLRSFISANNGVIGDISGSMNIVSQQLPSGLTIELISTTVNEDILSGYIYGTIPSGIYEIIDGITVEDGTTLTISPGTTLKFSNSSFNVRGNLIAEGSASDSILFIGNDYEYFGSNFFSEWRGIYMHNADDNTILNYVRVSNSDRGGLKLYNSDIIISNSNFSKNGTSNDPAGINCSGISMTDSSPEIHNSIISNNNGGTLGGGGLNILDSNPLINNCTINNNYSIVGCGLYIYNSDIELNNLIVNDNSGNDNYGAIHIVNSNGLLNNINISGNNTRGIYLADSDFNFNRLNISDNSGGIYIHDSNAILRHLTITRNYNTDYAGNGIRGIFSSIDIINSIIWDNRPNAGSVYIWGDSNFNMNYCNIDSIITQYPFIGVGNISQNPEFVSTEAGWIINEDWCLGDEFICSDLDMDGCQFMTYAGLCDGWIDNEDEFIGWGNHNLQIDSPCIDAGIEVEDMEYYGSAPDMGMFEYIPGEDLDNDDIIPTNYSLSPAYPNPFNPTTNISFSVLNYDKVSISVYDISGRFVTTLSNDYYTPGNHTISWNASSYSSGVYFIRMKSTNFIDTQKIVLLK